MAEIKQIKVGSNTYDVTDVSKLPLTGGTLTGDLIINAPHRDQYYASNLCRHFHSGTPTEFVIKTKIKFASGTHMPVIRIYGYAYGLNSPIELRAGFYIYNDIFGWAGVSCTGAWKPEVYLFKYTENSVDYVALGLKGSCYFCGFQVDAQIGALGSFGNNFQIDGWSTSHNGTDTTKSIIPAVGTDKCLKIDYKPMQTDIGGNAATATTATKAIQDESGNNIKATYASSLSVNGRTITLKNKNGSALSNITTPDPEEYSVSEVQSACSSAWG